VEDLKRRLEDSRKQLEGNEQMIRWLNSQINEAQLHYGAALGARYAFRPGVPGPATMPSGSPAMGNPAPSRPARFRAPYPVHE
jgi:spindle assembly abnormal protein 6